MVQGGGCCGPVASRSRGQVLRKDAGCGQPARRVGERHRASSKQVAATSVFAGARAHMTQGVEPHATSSSSPGPGATTRSPHLTKGSVAANDAPDSWAGFSLLAMGPYLVISTGLDAACLCRTDATCRLLRALNRSNAGPWRASGAQHFYGIELDRDGLFIPERDSDAFGPRKSQKVDWKGRYIRFLTEVPLFRAPFSGSEVTSVLHPDEVAYCQCRLRADLLSPDSTGGMYLEVEVLSNPDNLSLAIVDFEAGGRSSVTFSPDTGAVIRERKVQEVPRKVKGAYIQTLEKITPGRRFEGSIGLYLRGGHVAFFRRCSYRGEDASSRAPWESTGFVTDLAWAEGQKLTPCLAFHDEGAYHVRFVTFGPEPPYIPHRAALAYNEANWSTLDWEPPPNQA